MSVRKLIISLILLSVCAVSSAQTELKSFYGLNIGEQYNEQALLNVMIAAGMDRKSEVSRDTLATTGLLAYTFQGALDSLQDYDNPTQSVVSLIVDRDYRFKGVIITPQIEGAMPMAFISEDVRPDLFHYANANTRAVEGTFFGLDLGSDVSLASIVRAVGENGDYMRSDKEGKTRIHTFKELTFEGHQWDYAIFSVTPEGKFVAFTVYDIYEGALKGYYPANRLHLNMRDLYFKKYGIPFAESDGEEEISNEYIFSGQNGLDQVLSFFETETDRDKRAYCVQMEFVHDALNRRLL